MLSWQGHLFQHQKEQEQDGYRLILLNFAED